MKLSSLFCALAIGALFVTLGGCAGVAKRNAVLYQTARDADVEQTKAESLAESNATAARATAFAALAAKCAPADTACVVALGDKLVLSDAIAALKSAAKPAQSQTPIPYERDLAAKTKDVASGLAPIVLAGINADVAKTQSNNSTKVQLGEQTMVQNVVAGATGAARDTAVAAVENAQPNINVGGDYVPGTQHIGDAQNGNGNAAGGAQIGDTQNGDGNAAGGSHVGAAVEGVLVQESTDTQVETGDGDQIIEQGPGGQQSPITIIDNSNDGDECEGADCQTTLPPPEPVDPGT